MVCIWQEFGIINMDLVNIDKQIIWHPMTQDKLAGLPLMIERGEGPYLIGQDNKKYLDLISSWWVNLHGHANPKIARAIYEQALKLEQVIFAGFTHKSAIKLCLELQKILPSMLQRFFFSDNGSSAVEAAIKMAFQYWYNQGYHDKKSYISFASGYHGDTIGAMSVGQSDLHNTFNALFFKNYHIPFPDTWIYDYGLEKKEITALNSIKKIIQRHHKEIVAMVIEPLVQGAAGMRVCRAEFLQEVCKLCRDAGVLVIFDEVMTGFYRTGKNFAFEHIDFVPDILCLSKGLTGGFLPLALTITTKKIFTAFLGNNMKVAFTHSHSYTANPLGCAAAIASLKLLRQKETEQNIAEIKSVHQQGIKRLYKAELKLEKFRQIGTIAAFDFMLPEDQDHFFTMIALRKKFIEHGYIIRPIGKTIYVLPPYCIKAEQLQSFYDQIPKILQAL